MTEFKGNEYGLSENRLVCPYNKSHVVPIERMAIHLVGCRKQHPDMDVVVCPLNAMHHVRKVDYQRHIKECNSKGTVERTMFKEAHFDLTTLPAHATVNSNNSKLEDDEHWDSDPSTEVTYNPTLEAIYKPIFRKVPHELGSSGKKRWRKVEEERIKRIQDGDCINDLQFPTADGGIETIEDIIYRNGVEPKEKPASLMSEQSAINKGWKVDDQTTLCTEPETKTEETVNFPGFNPSQKMLADGQSATNDGKRRKKKKAIKLTEMSEIESIKDSELPTANLNEIVNRNGSKSKGKPVTLMSEQSAINIGWKVGDQTTLCTEPETKTEENVNFPGFNPSQKTLADGQSATNDGKRRKKKKIIKLTEMLSEIESIKISELPTANLNEIVNRNGSKSKGKPVSLMSEHSVINKGWKVDDQTTLCTEPETKTEETVNFPGFNLSKKTLADGQSATNDGKRRKKKKAIKLTASEIEDMFPSLSKSQCEKENIQPN